MGSGATTRDAADGAAFAVERSGGTLRLTGDFRMREAPAIWRELHRSTEGARDGISRSTFRERVRLTEPVMALIVALRTELAARGVRTDIQGTAAHLRPLVELYGAEAPPEKRMKREPESAIEQVGRATVRMGEGLEGVVAFLGKLVVAGLGARAKPPQESPEGGPAARRANGRRRRADCGGNQLPDWLRDGLPGLEPGLGAARGVGAALYIADLVGLTVDARARAAHDRDHRLRTIGAAFAAEIGSMKDLRGD